MHMPPQVPEPEEDHRVAAFYERLVDRHGVHPRAVDWGSRASQQKRFDILAEIGDLPGCSVLDVGCGLADLHAYLESAEKAVSYTGYDISPAILEAARKRFPNLDLRQADLMREEVAPPRFDFVFASGIFHLRPKGSYAYLEAMTRRMYRSCRRGVAFNSLSARSSVIEPDKFVAEPTKVLDICLDIAPNVVLRHDYLPHDFTVYLYKSGSQ